MSCDFEIVKDVVCVIRIKNCSTEYAWFFFMVRSVVRDRPVPLTSLAPELLPPPIVSHKNSASMSCRSTLYN